MKQNNSCFWTVSLSDKSLSTIERYLKGLRELGEFIREVVVNNNRRYAVKVEEIIKLDHNPTIEVGQTVEFNEMYVDFIGVEPNKP